MDNNHSSHLKKLLAIIVDLSDDKKVRHSESEYSKYMKSMNEVLGVDLYKESFDDLTKLFENIISQNKKSNEDLIDQFIISVKEKGIELKGESPFMKYMFTMSELFGFDYFLEIQDKLEENYFQNLHS